MTSNIFNLSRLHIIVKRQSGSGACPAAALHHYYQTGAEGSPPELCSRIGSDNFNIGVRSNMAAYGWKY